MPINDSLIGAVTMKFSATLPASTKSRVAGTSPHRLAFKEKSSLQNICAPGLRVMQCNEMGDRGMSSTKHDKQKPGWSRRNFLATSMVSTMSVSLLDQPSASAAPIATDPHAPHTTTININGQRYHLALDVRTTLLDALRDHIGLTGSKKGCDHGQCGACTVMVNDRRVLSCLTLVASVEGRNVTTIEGLSQADGTLHPMQQAFIDHDAFQCGYCTPGQIVSAVACVKEGHAGTDADIREYMSGNLCRCAAYPNIVEAINQAKTRMKEA
jgi:xanthine dehydrogenase YagT iron-sulfur-binding subunit